MSSHPQSKRAWLWVAVTPLISFFCVKLSRSTEAAQALLGENFEGILNSAAAGTGFASPLQCLQLGRC